MTTEEFPQCTVTVQARDAQGRALPGASVTALLSRTSVYGTARLPKRTEGQTGADGLCRLRLFQNGAGASPSQYKIRIRHPQMQAQTLAVFIPAGTQAAQLTELVVGELPAAPSGSARDPEPGKAARRLPSPAASAADLAALVRDAQLTARNSVNLAKSAFAKGAVNSITQLNTCRYNLMLGYGQSLMQGNHAWPALSRTSHHGNLMLGDCVRPASLTAPAFVPLGEPVFRPLVERVQHAVDDALLSDEQVAQLSPQSGSRGESVLSGALNSLKRLHNDSLLLSHDDSRLFVAGNAAVGGRSIEELSKNATPQLYARCTDFIRLAKQLADAEGASCAVSAVFWMQGENNYRQSGGGTPDKDRYKQLLVALRQDLNEDIAALCGSDQHRPPAFFTYQAGASWTRDGTLLAIGMAQWEFTREQAGCYLVGPTYAYTDKGHHLDANGTRWFGNQLGKVAHRVLTLRQDWRPLAPMAVQAHGLEIEIDFNVPEPPLQWRRPYVQTTATDFPGKGFRVSDKTGELAILQVQIVADTVVRLTLDRAPGPQAFVWYASKQTEGRGCLCDSDPAVAHDCYEYRPGSGQYPEANLPALVGRPYPLHNWCIAFRLPIPWRL